MANATDCNPVYTAGSIPVWYSNLINIIMKVIDKTILAGIIIVRTIHYPIRLAWWRLTKSKGQRIGTKPKIL